MLELLFSKKPPTAPFLMPLYIMHWLWMLAWITSTLIINLAIQQLNFPLPYHYPSFLYHFHNTGGKTAWLELGLSCLHATNLTVSSPFSDHLIKLLTHIHAIWIMTLLEMFVPHSTNICFCRNGQSQQNLSFLVFARGQKKTSCFYQQWWRTWY